MPTARALLDAISRLPKKELRYVNPKTTRRIHRVRVEADGSITYRRYDPANGESAASAKDESIESSLVDRVAKHIRAGKPFNIDRIVGGSYNSRSVLEALLARTPNFFVTYPGRVEVRGSHKTVKRGNKHLVWEPTLVHANGVLEKRSGYKPISE